MSSHHITRDDQEPALIIANGAECSSELLGQLLEWSPLVIVLDSSIERVLPLGIKIDVLLGDLDGDFNGNFDADKYQNLQYPLKIIQNKDQDTTDLDKAFEYLIEQKIPSVNVVWATGKRMDHCITNITNIVRYQEKLKIVVLDDYSKIYRLPQKFSKWYPAKTLISIIPVGTVSGIITTNLDYPLNDESLVLGYRTGSSNSVSKDGLVTIEYATGDLLMMECTDE